MSLNLWNQRTPGLAPRALAICLLTLIWLAAPLSPALAQGLGVWRVGVTGLTEQAARENLAQYPDLPSAEVLPHEGRFGIFGGTYATEAEASAAKDALASQGILNLSVAFFPGAAAATAAPALDARAGGQGRFRVLAGTYATESDAMAQRKRLLDRGFINVDALPEGNVFKLYVGFESGTRREAETLGQNLRDQGFTYESIVDLSAVISRPPGARPTPTPDLDAVGRDYQARIRRAMDSAQYSEAERLIGEWERMDPLNLLIPAQRDELARARFAPPAATQAPPVAASPAPPVATAAPVETPQETFATLAQQANAAEQSGELEIAKNLWRRAQNLPNVTDSQKQEIAAAISRIAEREFAASSGGAQAPAPAAAGGAGQLLLYAVGGVVLLVVIGGVVLFTMKRRQAAPAPARPAASPVPPVKAPAKAPAPASPKPAAAPRVASESPSTEKFSVKELEELERQAAAARAAQAAAAQAPPPPPTPPDSRESSVVLLDGLGGEETPATEIMDDPAPSPQKPAADETAFAGTESEAWKRIPLVREPSTAPEMPAFKPAPPPAAPPPPPPPAPAAAAEKEVGSETQIDTSIPAQQRVQGGRVLIYKQSFDDEEAGSLPRGWSGQYDYATLKVAPREGKGQCMRFEKPTGSGSAFYSCKFPDAGGRVTVEFDLRCDTKNKYLLGFYVEKDADFRHSVHTVVHRDVVDMEKFYLRLQNETTPYALGKWVHVRFHIDLTRSLVDGYIDDAPGAVGVRLTSRPRYINTLSIRDNLATEGILLIDNIEIYQER